MKGLIIVSFLFLCGCIGQRVEKKQGYFGIDNIVVDGVMWKNDSTACKGDRLNLYKDLLSDLDKLTEKVEIKQVTKLIGKPNTKAVIAKRIYHHYYITGQHGCNPKNYTYASTLYIVYDLDSVFMFSSTMQP